MSASPWRHARKSALGHAVLSCLCNLVLLPCLVEPQQAAHNRTAGSPGPDLSCSVLAGGSKTFRVYLGHRTDLSSTRRAAESVLELGPAHITIVDQTAGFEAGRDPALQALSVEVIDAPGVFFFSGFSEFVRKHAIAKELDAYFWLHSDARLEVGVARAGLASLCALWESNMTWGAVFFKFDVFCAFSVDAVTKIGPWDSGIPHYRADSDYYRRMDRLNFTRCQNPRAQADACHGVPALRAIWPEDGFQIAHEGSIFLKRQEQEVIAEERWAYWLFDYVGRYVYFPLKWGFPVEWRVSRLGNLARTVILQHEHQATARNTHHYCGTTAPACQRLGLGVGLEHRQGVSRGLSSHAVAGSSPFVSAVRVTTLPQGGARPDTG